LVPRITLKSIANNEEPEMVTLVDRPEVKNKITRVCGPFTVEATIQAALTLAEEDNQAAEGSIGHNNPRAYLDRMIEVLRQSKTLQLPGNMSLELEAVRPVAAGEHIHAEATAKNGSEKRIAIVFGPEDGAIGSEYVFNASMEAMQQGFQQLFLFGFAIQAKAREMLEKLKIPTTYVAMTPDVVMSDLLKTSRSSEIFSITGLPDVTLKSAGQLAGRTPAPSRRGKGSRYFPARYDGNGLYPSRKPAVLDAGHQLQRHGVLRFPSVLPENRGLGQPAKIAQGRFQRQPMGTSRRNGQRAFRSRRQAPHRGQGD
jgi:hypothetical protein